ncbi:MAG: alpha/beta hydrolase [Candidatus Omnitrophica bacterium]|nr:alpha/beta hydrolase [Candidatus Omnitrophota bacterium]
MTSQASPFKVLDRGFKKTICLIPGWATDYRIFSLLELDYNYLLPVDFSPVNFKDKLSQLLKEEYPGKISLLGWSQGGFLAADFTLDNPGWIEELILVSMRRHYPACTLEGVRGQLNKSRKAYLYRFYLDCFCDADKESLSWFRKNLLRDYLSEMRTESLMEGLDYLSGAGLDLGRLASLEKTRFFHGAEDNIAPAAEVAQIQAGLPRAEFIYIKGCGHIPLLSRIFREEFYRG